MIVKLNHNNIIHYYFDIISKYGILNNYYYNTITNEYFGENSSCRFYFNLEMERHRLDGPAHIGEFNIILFYINGIYYRKSEFAVKTNHLICKNCKEFCKQRCFL